MTSTVPQSQTEFHEARFVNSMAAKMWSLFVASLVIFMSLKEASTKPLDTENATEVDSGRIIVKGDYYALNLYLDKGVETALSEMQKKIEFLEGRLDALERPGMFVSYFDVMRSMWLAIFSLNESASFTTGGPAVVGDLRT